MSDRRNADPAWTTSHEWVRWLSGPDAQVLLLRLCQALDMPDTTLEQAQQLVQGWRANALKALTADDWTAPVDGYLEVRVDARLALMSQGKLS